MRTQNSELSLTAKILSFGIPAVVVLGLVLVTSSDLKNPWKKKQEPVKVVQEIKKVSLEDYVKSLVSENYSWILEGSSTFSSEIPPEKVQGDFVKNRLASNQVIISNIDECCYTPDEIIPWIEKYKIPSLVYSCKSGTQLPYNFPIDLSSEKEEGKIVRINKVEGEMNPEIIAKFLGKFWLFDKNGKELPKW